ncbi:MAG: hypothetical protein VB032_06065, partial [Burkholderiaceae bacterium]|nr:hypothetical protein [Burkholderiaceae bacterium]
SLLGKWRLRIVWMTTAAAVTQCLLLHFSHSKFASVVQLKLCTWRIVHSMPEFMQKIAYSGCVYPVVISQFVKVQVSVRRQQS